MDLVKDPIPTLIRRIAVPASVGFFFNTMYNVVDTYFAGQVSTSALAALSLSFPVFFILLAVGSGVGQGATALIANAIGEGRTEKAHHLSMQAISFSVCLAAVLTVVGWWTAPAMFRFLGAAESYLDITLTYFNTILAGTISTLLQSVLNSSLNAQGDTKTYRNVLCGGFVLNCVLDPWFLYGGFGLPAMGIRGIALATVLIQSLGCFYMAFKMTHSRIWRGWSWKDLRPEGSTYREIAGQGFPASLNMMTIALGIFVITWFISQFGQDGVAAYGAATRIEQIFLLPTIGLNISILSLTGQNNGARRYDRIRESLACTMKYGMSMMAAAGLIVFGFGYEMMRWFTETEEVARIGAEYLRIAAITLPSYMILFQTVFMLQGLKRPMYAIWIGLYRQIVAPVTVFYLLAVVLDWKLPGIWWGIFLVTWSAAIFTFFYGRWKLNQVESQSKATAAATFREPKDMA